MCNDLSFVVPLSIQPNRKDLNANKVRNTFIADSRKARGRLAPGLTLKC